MLVASVSWSRARDEWRCYDVWVFLCIQTVSDSTLYAEEHTGVGFIFTVFGSNLRLYYIYTTEHLRTLSAGICLNFWSVVQHLNHWATTAIFNGIADEKMGRCVYIYIWIIIIFHYFIPKTLLICEDSESNHCISWGCGHLVVKVLDYWAEGCEFGYHFHQAATCWAPEQCPLSLNWCVFSLWIKASAERQKCNWWSIQLVTV